MAVAYVRGAISGNTATGTVSITAPTAGNLLVAFGVYVGTSTPTFTDSASGSWTVYTSTSTLFASSANSIFVAYKVAGGSETSITTSGNTPQGCSYVELSGAAASIANAVATNNLSSATSATTSALTTSGAGMILTAVGRSGGSFNPGVWTGTHIMTNVATTTTRDYIGYYSSASGETSQTYTSNWVTSASAGLLTVNIGPSGAGVSSGDGFFGML